MDCSSPASGSGHGEMMISITEGLEMMNLERGIGLRFEKMRKTTKKIAFIQENSWIMVTTVMKAE